MNIFLQKYTFQGDIESFLVQFSSKQNLTSNLCNYLLFSEQLMELMHARARRRFARGLKRKPMALVKKLRRAKKEAPPNEKPEIVKTHLRNMIIVPEMVGSIVGIYNGKTFNQVRTFLRNLGISFILYQRQQKEGVFLIIFYHSNIISFFGPLQIQGLEHISLVYDLNIYI